MIRAPRCCSGCPRPGRTRMRQERPRPSSRRWPGAHRDHARGRAHRGGPTRSEAARAARSAERCPRRGEPLGRDGTAAGRAAPATRRGRGVTDEDRGGGLRGAPAARARPPRRRAAAARLARDARPAPAALVASGSGDPLARVRSDRRRDRRRDRRSAPDRGRRSPRATRRWALGGVDTILRARHPSRSMSRRRGSASRRASKQPRTSSPARRSRTRSSTPRPHGSRCAPSARATRCT